MCVVNLKSVNKLDLTWKQSFLILDIEQNAIFLESFISCYLSLLQPNHLFPFPRIEMHQNRLNKMKQKIN